MSATPYHSWERGLNEHTNGLLRQFFPKGTNFKILKPEEVERAVNLINNRPRKCLDYRTPNEVFYKGRLDSDATQTWIGLFLESLPLTTNLKVDRRALPAPTESQDQKTLIAPRTATEKIVAEIWQDVLGLKQISIFDNFFDLGGHSLKAAQVISRLREQLAINIPLNYLFSEPTVAGLSSNLDLNLSDKIESDQIPDWQIEITLDPSIQPPKILTFFPQKTADILLTGATGFLGIHLLAELLDKTEANIHCLIRDKSLEQAQAKIYQKLKTFQLWDEQKSSRIIPVIGDLSQQRLGMCQPDFLELANQIDVIYHNGAWVNAI
jgi:acyl carrier protein